jgi:hypothetical protein
MRNLLSRRPSPALVVSLVALSVALGGTGYAAVVLPANSVGTKQLKRNAVTTAKIQNASLLAADFKPGQLPAGPPGPAGATGATGAAGARGLTGEKGDKGDDGSPDTPPQVLAKLAQVDGSGSGLDADTVDGTEAPVLAQSAGLLVLGAEALPQVFATTITGFNVDTVPAASCADKSSFGILNLQNTDRLVVQRTTPPTSGIVDTFRIFDAPPRISYGVCNTTNAPIDPPNANFRVTILR